MAITPSGKISFSDLRTEFTGSNPVKLSDYYRGGSLVPNTVTNQLISTAGAISLSSFYSASAAVGGSGAFYDLYSRLSVQQNGEASSIIARNAAGNVYSMSVYVTNGLAYFNTANEDGSIPQSYSDTNASWGSGLFRAATFNAAGNRFYAVDSSGYVWRFAVNSDGTPNYSSRTFLGASGLFVFGNDYPCRLVVSADGKYISGFSKNFLYSPTGGYDATNYSIINPTNISGWPYDPDEGEAGFGNNNQFATSVSPTGAYIASYGMGDGEFHAAICFSSLSGSSGSSPSISYWGSENNYFSTGVFTPDGSHFFALMNNRSTIVIFRLNGGVWQAVSSINTYASITSIEALQNHLAVSTPTSIHYIRWSDQSYVEPGGTQFNFPTTNFNPQAVSGVQVPYLRKYQNNKFIAAGYTSYYNMTEPSSAGIVYAGGSTDPYMVIQGFPSDGSGYYIANPAPGYNATLDIFLAGTASQVGSYWAPDNKGGPQASGESAYFKYLCRGDEDGFLILQNNFNGATSQAYASLRVAGGVNNGLELRVGSGATSASFGAAGAPTTRAASSTLPATLMYNGATRFYNSTISYSDATSYTPASEASYGAGLTVSKTYGSQTVVAQYNNGGGSSLVINGSVVYNNPPVKNPGDVTSGNAGQRPGQSGGGVALVFLNDY